MAEHAPKPMFSSSPEVSAAQREAFRNAIASALTAYGNARLEEAAKVAQERLAEAEEDRDVFLKERDHEYARAETLEAALATLREEHPEPEGVVEEPPRDNAPTDAW
jgi:hypothetical protein